MGRVTCSSGEASACASDSAQSHPLRIGADIIRPYIQFFNNEKGEHAALL